MQPTIRDVAKQAGVSIATVSRVMRDSTKVREETRVRVAAAIADLEFTPSSLGRSLAERRHAANGIVFPDLSGPYFAEVVLGYEAMAAELGRSVLILSTHGRDAAPSMVEAMAGRCDGLVIMGRTVPDQVVTRIAARGVPIVLLARPEVPGIDTVKAENTETATELTRNVVASGARNLAFVGDPLSSPDVAERWSGVSRAAAEEEGVTVTEVRPNGFDEDSGAEVARKALERGLPDAFICTNDELALGVLGELRDERSRRSRPGLRDRLGRRDGGEVRRTHDRSPTDARTGGNRGPSPGRAHHRLEKRAEARRTTHRAGCPDQLRDNPKG